MPQMSPYNWLILNILFMIMLYLYITLMNFIPLKNKIYTSPKKITHYKIKW